MVTHYITLHLSEDERLRYYAGEATHIRCVSTTGQVIQIAARHFRRFTQKAGIHGVVKLTLRHKTLVSLNKIG